GRGRAGPRVGEEERAPSRPSARPRCGAAGAERDRLAHAAWNEYDACAPSGCLRMRGILLGRSPRILRLQTVFRILTSAHSCRIRDYPVLEAIVDRYPTVVEINSDDVREYRLMLSSTKYLLHRLSRSRLLRRVRGMVFVTGEIVSRPYFARFDKPALVLGNSISLSDYYVLPAPCNRVPRLVFSGLGKSPWHGLDKVLHLAASCPDFTFDVIGHATDDFGQRIPDNVQVHGVLTRPAYEPILARA